MFSYFLQNYEKKVGYSSKRSMLCILQWCSLQSINSSATCGSSAATIRLHVYARGKFRRCIRPTRICCYNWTLTIYEYVASKSAFISLQYAHLLYSFEVYISCIFITISCSNVWAFFEGISFFSIAAFSWKPLL